jgi:hypothetical protein
MKFLPILIAAYYNTVADIKATGSYLKEGFTNFFASIYEAGAALLLMVLWAGGVVFAIVVTIARTIGFPGWVVGRAVVIYCKGLIGYHRTMRMLNDPTTPATLHDIERYEHNIADLTKHFGIVYPEAIVALEAMKIKATLAGNKC